MSGGNAQHIKIDFCLDMLAMAVNFIAYGHGRSERWVGLADSRTRGLAAFLASVCFLSGGFLVLGGVLKGWDSGALELVLVRVWGVSGQWSRTAALVMSGAEVGIGALLLWSKSRVVGLELAMLFLALVSISPMRQLAMGSELGCGCGLTVGVWDGAIGQWLAVGRNAMMICLLGAATLLSPVSNFNTFGVSNEGSKA